MAIMSVPRHLCRRQAHQPVRPIGYFMDTEDLLKFTVVTPVSDAIAVMAKVRHRYFPHPG